MTKDLSLDFAIRASIGIQIPCGLHSREEREVAGRMSVGSQRPSVSWWWMFQEGSRDQPQWPVGTWQEHCCESQWPSLGAGITGHASSGHCPSADSSRARTTVSSELWYPSAQHSLALSKCSGKICWINEGRRGLTVQMAIWIQSR